MNDPSENMLKLQLGDFQKQNGELTYETVKLVCKCFKKIVDAIEELCDASETIKTRGAAQTLLPAMCDFSFLCLWNDVLKEVDHFQKCLQILGISFEKSVI
ncbi:hypothetical protein AVEN_133725-1 [Araneus ventricosus]|uniref:Uncharacterized protein n=1 Tax=Araneus ventricosus TaxID=182803 RepID=A0A4Y2B6V7_ARAVE|nr:hypothetical protein AVEN_133725-1 [Araneus ventricosus]